MPISRKTRNRADADELVASARIDIRTPEDMQYLKAVRSISSSQGKKPWKWYKNIGEVHYAISRGARVAGYANLQARQLNADGTLGKVISGGVAGQTAARIQSPYGGRRALIERYITLMKVPGDAYLIRCRVDDEVVGYDFISADEIDLASLDTITTDTVIQSGQPIKRITLPKTSGNEQMVVDIEPRDFLGRVWRPAMQFVDQSDSPMRASETNCELLDLLTRGLKAKMLNRLVSNGIVYIPSEINDIRTGTPKGNADKISDSKVIDRLLNAGLYMMQNFDDPAAALPAFVTGPAQYADAIKHIVMDREIWKTDMELRAELIDRILMGLDVQPQDVKGMGDANHWSAWAVSDDERRVNIQPDMETLCWALTNMILHVEMEAAGVPPGRIAKTVLWYDLTKANVKTNLAEDARQAGDRIWISAAAGRRYTGFDESDAPSEVEYIRELGRQMKDPYLATFQMDIADKIDFEKVVSAKKDGPDPASTADDPKVGPGSSSGTPDDSETDTPRRLRPA